jgi:hypothetical protein
MAGKREGRVDQNIFKRTEKDEPTLEENSAFVQP